MKCAVLLKGAISRQKGQCKVGADMCPEDYVDFYACEKSLKKHIFNLNSDVDFEFYIYSWSTHLEKELIKLYNPVKYVFEDYNNHREYINQIINQYNFNPEYHRAYISTLSQALNIKLGLELIESSGINYDLILICRMDVLMWDNLDLKQYDLNNIYANACTVKGGGDLHFIMNPKNASIFKNCFDSALVGNPPYDHQFFRNYVTNFMKKEITEDNLKQDFDLGPIRAIYKCNYEPGALSYDKIKDFGINFEEFKNYEF